MTDEERSIQKNKIIITIAILVVVFIGVGYTLLNSTLNDELYFRYAYNQKTGEQLNLASSLLIYFFIFGVFGIPHAGCVFLFMMYLYYFLHRKDKRLFRDRSYCPDYEEEFHYGGRVALRATYTARFILMLLHISNVITINDFIV